MPEPSPSQAYWDQLPEIFPEDFENIPAGDSFTGNDIADGDDMDDDDVDEDGPVGCLAEGISQNSSFSLGGEEDISSLIQLWEPEPPPTLSVTDDSSTTASTSSSSLGKRSASDASLATEPRASKMPKEESPSLYDPVVVAYSKAVQKWIEDKNLPWGVEWELARLVSIGKLEYEDVKMEQLNQLKNKGSNAEGAPLAERIVLGKDVKSEAPIENDPFSEERAAKFPYRELDLEEENLSKDCHAGLGFNENSDWFGGKVVFRGKLRNFAEGKDAAPQFKIELEKPELGASSRFTRRFGSKSFMRVKIHKSLWRFSNQLMDFLRRPFIVAGKVYRAFLEKEKNVFFFMTNEVPESQYAIGTTILPGRFSFMEFLNWHNPIELNQQQSAAKFASRFALGLSTSAPGIQIKPEDIVPIEDIVSFEGSDMTDGAGLLNKTAQRHLSYKFESWDNWPTAIQCRILGAKGMLLQHPSDDSLSPRVYLRPSMVKIQYPDSKPDPAQCVIDVLRACHPRFRCRLSSETIINLADNGVPLKVLCDLLDRSLNELITSLTTWDTDESMEDLWVTVSRLGGVFAARAARRKSGMARVSGFSERDTQEDGDEDGLDAIDEEESSTAWWNDEVSGQPSSLEETVMRLADAGFRPQTCPVMREKLKSILSTHISNSTLNFRIEVPMSFTAFILPDPEGVLQEGEIYFKSSHRDLLTSDGQGTDVLLGPSLVTRHPCKLPTDVQKWTAVDRPELRHFTDVIILSTKGARRAADWLGGGDYDGDKALVLYQPEIVQPFTNADKSFGDPRDDIKAEYFSKHTETVTELLNRSPSTAHDPLATVHALQEYLLGGIKTASLVGQASNMHDYLVYTEGTRNPETIRMAHIFCHTLDGAKTGLKVKAELWKKDCIRYDMGTMHWKESEAKGKGKADTVRTDNILVKRPKALGPFIMEQLKAHAKKKADDELGKLEDMYDLLQKDLAIDEHLIAPWNEALNLADRLATEKRSSQKKEALEKIKAHVERLWEEHRNAISNLSKAHTKKSRSSTSVSFTDLPIEARQDVLRRFSRAFMDSPNPDDLFLSADDTQRLKASYAYLYDYEKAFDHWTRFPWDVAMRELTAIKAKALGGSTTVQSAYYERFALKKRR